MFAIKKTGVQRGRATGGNKLAVSMVDFVAKIIFLAVLTKKQPSRSSNRTILVVSKIVTNSSFDPDRSNNDSYFVV
ncbi:MAG: hypothetical protein QNJ54_31955 [Prochloraceae cyanobacterium]|nr:hypothetical protein [Prochloraceae cyanobacterium]